MTEEQNQPKWHGQATAWAEDMPRATTADLAHTLPRVIADRYQLDAVIAEGGMSLVYRATQLQLGRMVAVKVMRPDTIDRRDEYLDRFVTEAATLARVSHPNVVTIHDYGQTEEDDAFIAMEYLQGRLLADLIGTATPMYVPQAVHIAIQIARAMRAAHQEGALHRDLKPSNVILVQGADDDDFNHVKVIDFGLARLGAQGGFHGKGLYGSPRYMAPEQIAGESLDPRSDIYALGCIVFAMISGRPPFDAETPRDILAAHLQDPVPSMASVGYRRAGTVELDHFVRLCLEKRPEARFQSMAEVVRELKRVYGNLPAQSADLVDAQGVPLQSSHYSLHSTDVDMTPAGQFDRPSGIYDVAPTPPTPAAPLPPSPERFPSTAPRGIPYSEPLPAPTSRSGDIHSFTGQHMTQPRSRPLLVVFIIIGLAVVAAGAWMFWRQTPEPETATNPALRTYVDIRLSIDSEPSAVQVFEEGVLVGVTPMVRTLPESAKGTSRTFVFKRDGFTEVRRVLELRGPEERIHVSLARAEVVIEDTPPPAEPKRRVTRRPGRTKPKRQKKVPAKTTLPETSATAAEPEEEMRSAPSLPSRPREEVGLIDGPQKNAVPILDDVDDEANETPRLDDETPLLD